jgi:hypothetical protein
MRVDQIRHEHKQVSALLGRDRLLLPDPVGRLILRLAHAPHGATLHDHRATAWVFPGQVAGHPITVERLRRRLSADLGKLPVRPGRHSAVTSMLRDVPAPVLADLLGFSQNRAHKWAELAASNYTTYVAARHPTS